MTIFLLLSGCGEPSDSGSASAENSKWEECKSLYTTVVHYSGEDDSTEKYLEIAERSQELLKLLEENVDAFIMNAYNYQSMDDEGTPLYTMNGLSYPVEIAPNGQCIQVSKNYFHFNPIETADEGNLEDQLTYDDLTLNVLVPEKYRDMESQIIEAHRADFFFQKVTAENDYNEMAGIDKRSEVTENDLKINVIYVKDNQKYFTYRTDCAAQTDNWITDPVVQVYTHNIHCNYAHSAMSQWVYFPSDAGNTEGAFTEIQPFISQCGTEDSFQKVESVYENSKTTH